MTKLKIGDKVKVLTNEETSLYWHSLKEGGVGVVVGLGGKDGLDDYEVEAPLFTHTGKLVVQTLHSSELEIVNE